MYKQQKITFNYSLISNNMEIIEEHYIDKHIPIEREIT